MLGLRRLKLDAIWLELLPGTGNQRADQANIENFQRRMREHDLAGRYCLLYQKATSDTHNLDAAQCIGISKRALIDRLAGPNVLLNLSYSIHPPFLSEFEQKIFCDLDPSEIFYWMTKMEMGQSYHDEFWTIGLNVRGRDCRLPASKLKWKTFYPLVDTRLLRPEPRPSSAKFTTIGQWYWGGAVEVEGEFPDLSKKFAFERYLDLPRRVPEAHFELAMNISADDPERKRLARRGWHLVSPHRVVPTPRAYRRYIASAAAEFTAIKGVDVAWKTGWLSDRAAAFLALGRPVITEDTGAAKYLPRESGFQFVLGPDDATHAVRDVIAHWGRWSKHARRSAVDVFDSAANLRRILDL